jgi:hypothetical protein
MPGLAQGEAPRSSGHQSSLTRIGEVCSAPAPSTASPARCNGTRSSSSVLWSTTKCGGGCCSKARVRNLWLSRSLWNRRVGVGLALPSFVEALAFINRGRASPTPTGRWSEFNAPIWDRACTLWSALRARGRCHNDADVLIAAHALHYGAVIVSANLEHFQGTGASVENWDEPLVRS